jgi:hypothetical protein
MAVNEGVSTYTGTANLTPAGSDTVGPDLDNHLRSMKGNVGVVHRHGDSTHARGRFWADQSASPVVTMKYSDGGQNISLFEIDEDTASAGVTPYIGSQLMAGIGKDLAQANQTASAATLLGIVASTVLVDTTPQLGGFLDTNDKFVSFSQGANVASVAGDTNIWGAYDGNTVHITGTNAITDFGTPKQAGDSMWLVFDAAASVVDSATITVAGNTNFQAAANDLALVYALSTSTFLFIPFKNSGLPPVYDADTLKADTDDVLTGGFGGTDDDDGTKSSGTYTPTYAGGNFKLAVNGGAHTLAPQSGTGTIIIQYTCDGSAGSITTSGWTIVTGDSFTTTSGHDFMVYLTVVAAFKHLHIVALQ